MDNLTNGIRGGTLCITNPAVIMDASGTEDFEITPANMTYVIEGLFYTVASGDGDVKLDGHTVTTLKSALFVACVDSSGTITTVKSDEVLNTDLSAGDAVLHWPEPTADTCPFCGMVVTNATASVFTGGTTGLDTASVTYDVYDFAVMPEAPITAIAT